VSVIGGTEELRIVTAFRGSREWTTHKDFPSFLSTQNHLLRYKELECLYTPDANLSFIMRTTLSMIPGGIGPCFSIQGMCDMCGIMIRSKYSSLNLPLSSSFHANA
jgi:hypothetical protein